MLGIRNSLRAKWSAISKAQDHSRPSSQAHGSYVETKAEQQYYSKTERRSKRSPEWSDYADLTISSRGLTWPVHKLILCTQSDFFRNACKETYKEGKENVIYLEDDEPQVISAMLSFLYEKEYEPPADVNPLAFHAHVAAIADKYFIQPLQRYTEYKFNEETKKSESLNAFPDAIVAAYESENEHMIKTVIEVTKSNHHRLFSKVSEPDGFREVLREIPEYAVAAAEALAEELRAADKELSAGVRIPKKKLNEMTWYRCPDYACEDDNVVFAVPTRLRNQYISCPFKCEKGYDRNSRFWAKHKTTSPFLE